MAVNKKDHEDLDLGAFEADLGFEMPPFGEGNKDTKKRTPIRKISIGAAKGIASHVTSEGFIRQTVARSLPKGYDTAADAFFDTKHSLRDLYHSTASEWRKVEPAFRRAVGSAVSPLEKVLPRNFRRKIQDYAKGGPSPSAPAEDENERLIRDALGDLTLDVETRHAQERAEDNAAENLRSQAKLEQGNDVLKALASINSHVARKSAIDNQFFARAQKRSLELQYRSYFLQREAFVLQTRQAAEVGEALRALVHNTALPDADKLENSERIREGVRRRIGNFASTQASEYARRYFPDAIKRAKGMASGAISGFGSLLGMGSMMSSMGDMGGMIDPQEMKASMAGEQFASSIGQYLASRVGQGMRRSGRVAQIGATLHRAITNAPQRISKLSRRSYQNPVIDALAGLSRSILNPDFAENRTIGISPLHGMGQSGMLTRQFQRSVETVMPGYLARILHELEIQRMGKSAPLTTFNERSGTFTGAVARHRDITNAITSSSNAKSSASQINNMTSWMLGGSTISPRARSHLSATIATMIHSGEEFNPAQVMKAVSAMDKDSGREVRGALRGRFRGAMSHGSDQTVLSQGSDMWRSASNSMHSAYGEMSGMDDAGMRQDLINSGLATLDHEGKLNIHTENYMRNLYGNLNPEEAIQYGRGASNHLYSKPPSMVDQFRDKRVDLYKAKNASGKPVIEGSKVRSGAYTSLKTGQPIYFMHDVEDGVAENGRTLATAQTVLKLYTNTGITFEEWLRTNERVKSSDDPVTRMMNAADDRLRNAGAWVDSQIDRATGHTRAWRPDATAAGPSNSGVTTPVDEHPAYDPSIYSTVNSSNTGSGNPHLDDMLRTVGDHLDKLQDRIDEYSEAKGKHPAEEAAARSAPITPKPASAATATASAPEPQTRAKAESSSPFVRDDVDRLIEVLNEFKEQSAEQMDQLRESMDHLGEAAAEGNATGAKKSFWQRMKESRFGLFGRTGGAAVGAAGRATKHSARAYSRYVKTLVTAPFRGSGAFTRFVTSPFRGNPNHLGKEPADVYVGKVKVLTAGGMIAGSYVWVDSKTGKVGGYVKVPRDIKGPVMSSDLKETLISADDLRNKTITDRLGHSLVSKGFRAAFSVVGAAGKGYAAALKLPFQALSGLTSTIRNVANRLKRPIDVYVKGEREPRLTAVGMRAGIYFLKDRPSRKVESPDDLTGEVAMMRNGEIETRISKEDYHTGLVDSRGRAIKPKVGIFASLVDKTLRGVGAAAGGFMSLLGSAFRTGGNLASIPFKMLSNLFNGRGLISIFGKNGGKVKDEETHKLLREVLRMMDHRLPENENYRKGSWQDKLKKDKEREEKAAEGTKAAGGPSGSGLFSRLAGLFRKKKKDDSDDSDSSGSSVADDISAAKDAADVAKGVGSKGARVLRKARVWARKGGRWLGRLGKAGAVAEGAEGLGSVASAVGSASGIAGGAAAVGETAAAAGAAVGTAAEVGAVGAAGAAAAGGSVLAGLLVPLALGAGALYGAYKLGQFAKKEYDLHRKAPFRNYRLTQYGFDITESGLDALKVLQLEDMLFPTVTVSGGKATFDAGKVAKMHDQIMDLFGKAVSHAWYNPVGWFHHRNVDDLAEEQNLNTWLAKRFRPVFLNWVVALKGLAPQVELGKVDESLNAKQKTSLLQSAASVDASVYNVASSPFEDLEMITGDRANQLLKVYYDAAKASISDDGKSTLKTVGKGIAAGMATVGSAIVPAVNASESKDVGRKKPGSAGAKASDDQKLKNATVLGAVSASSQVTVSTKANVQTQFAFLGGSLTALDAIRYKTYGLEDLKPDQVKAAFLLENDLYGHISYDANGVASYEGDASFWLDQYAGYFGVSMTDVHAKIRWFNWYAKRFLPTLLAFATAVKKQNRSLQPGDASSILKPAQQLEVANATIAATLKQGKTVVSVWTFTISPFDDSKLPTSSKICDPQLQALKNQANSVPMQAPSAKPPAKNAPNAPGAKPNLTTQMQSPASQQQQIDKSLKAPPPAPATSVMVGGKAGGTIAGAMSGGKPAAPIGSPVQQPGHGTGGDINKLPKVTGTGYAAMKPLLDAAAKMTGVDPKVLSEIVGIESDFDPNARPPSGTAAGLGQFINSTWHAMLTKYAGKYGINPQTPQTDPAASALMLGEYIHENQSYLTRRLKRAPTDAEIYAAHFLGPGGASQLLSLPSTEPVAGLMPGPAQQNPTIFYQNGQAATQGQIMGFFNRRLKQFRGIVTSPSATPAVPDAGGGDLSLVAVADHTSVPVPAKAADSSYKPASVATATKAPVMPSGPSTLASANSQQGSVMTPETRQALADNIATKKAQEVTHQNNAIIADHSQMQTDLLKGVLAQLTLLVGHQKATNAGIDNLAKVTMGSATAIAQATTNASKSASPAGAPTTTSNATRGQSTMPNLPVSMNHTNYA